MNEETQIGTEIAKGIGEAAKEVALNLLGPATTEAGLFAGDIIANWRMANLVKTYDKVLAKYPNKKLPKESLERLPFGFRALFVEDASREEEESVQTLWANLMKKSLGEGYSEQFKAFTQDLKNLSPIDVRIIECIHDQPHELYGKITLARDGMTFSHELKSSHAILNYVYESTDEQIQNSISKLIKLAIIEPIPDHIDSYDIGFRSGDYTEEVELLARDVIHSLQSNVPLTPPDPEVRYKKGVTPSGVKSVWFDSKLSVYGAKFTSTVIVDP